MHVIGVIREQGEKSQVRPVMRYDMSHVTCHHF